LVHEETLERWGESTNGIKSVAAVVGCKMISYVMLLCAGITIGIAS
jgi:hypothetical protein